MKPVYKGNESLELTSIKHHINAFHYDLHASQEVYLCKKQVEKSVYGKCLVDFF